MQPDVIPPSNGNEQRSIRNIPVPPNRKHFEPSPQGEDWADEVPGKGRGRRTFVVWGGIIVAMFAIAGLFASILFEGATVTAHPRTMQVTPPSSLMAMLDAPVGSLSYKLMTVSQTAQRTTPATGITQASESAHGTITIYNTYDTRSQKLVTNTRFETTDGKIYRIHAPVVVPGATKNADGTLKPGQTTAEVYADKPGAEYNIGQARLTIPGFKGDPRYDKFYAMTNGFSGGFVGPRPSVPKTELEKAEADMKSTLQGALTGAVPSQVPEGYVAVPGTLNVLFSKLETSDAGGGNANLSLSGTASQAIIRVADLASAIAKVQVQEYSGEPIGFVAGDLSLNVASGTPYTASSTSIALALGGEVALVWQFDPNAVQQALAGKPRDQFDPIIATFAPAIASAEASLRPFWKNSFPSDPSKIKVKISLEE